jgi:hypothetical protein
MIQSLIVPLLFGTLVVGIAGQGEDMKRVGRLAVRSLLYFEVVTTLALAVGLLAVNLVRPGAGVSLGGGPGGAGTGLAGTRPTFAAVLEHSVSRSFFEAAGTAGRPCAPTGSLLYRGIWKSCVSTWHTTGEYYNPKLALWKSNAGQDFSVL